MSALVKYRALGLLAKAFEVQRKVLATGAHIIGEDVVVGNFVALFGVVPEPAGVLDQFAVVVDEDVVDGDNTLIVVACVGIFLEDIQAPLVEGRRVPIDFREEAIETGLIGSLSKFAVDAEHGLTFGDEEAGEILAEMASLRFIGEEVTELLEGFLYDLRKLHDTRHNRHLLCLTAPAGNAEIMYKNAHFRAAA